MITRLMVVSAFVFPLAGLAASPLTPPLLPSTEIVRPLLEAEPSVLAAHAGLDAALQKAGLLETSPYEWTPRLIGQQRRVRGGPDYNEWNIGIERTVRLPGKKAADHKLGQAAVQLARARYGEALHEAARRFIEMWIDWLAGEQSSQIAEEGRAAIAENLAAVEKRVRAGDASRLDLSLAQADLAVQERQLKNTATTASAAWLRLSTRFPGVPHEVVPVRAPEPITQNIEYWRDLILSSSDELKSAHAELAWAHAHAERAGAERVPDPTFGLFTASEVGGHEQITGVTLSIPIPGDARAARNAVAAAEIGVSTHEAAAIRRNLEAEVESTFATARGAYEGLLLAEKSAAFMRDNAALMQRAYVLGEASLETMLLARRQANAAMSDVVDARVKAIKASYSLQLDGHLMWDLDRD
ncbi:MAG: TolC family protein [Gammaproteobacteria bacterium]|nr:TolC family protein [Gammaproteobacteria bacterium]MBI5616082.1 TolC family protein [Gammaproteobacteria bacterium]